MSLSKRTFKKVGNSVIASNKLSRNRLVNIFNGLKYSKNIEKMNTLLDEKENVSRQLEESIYKKRQLEEYIEKIRKDLHNINENIDTLRVKYYKLFEKNITCDNLSKQTRSYRNRFGKVITNFSKFTIIDKKAFKLLKENDIIGFFNKYKRDNNCWYYGQVVDKDKYHLFLDIGGGKPIYPFPYEWVEKYPASLLLYNQ